MKRILAAGLAAAVLCSAAAAQQEPPAEIAAYAAGQYGVSLIGIDSFSGDFTGDGKADAVAFIIYASGGNAAYLDVSLFAAKGGKLRHLRRVDEVFGGDPRDVVFSKGRIEVTLTTPRPGDPRCCPSGKTRYTIKP